MLRIYRGRQPWRQPTKQNEICVIQAGREYREAATDPNKEKRERLHQKGLAWACINKKDFDRSKVTKAEKTFSLGEQLEPSFTPTEAWNIWWFWGTCEKFGVAGVEGLRGSTET